MRKIINYYLFSQIIVSVICWGFNIAFMVIAAHVAETWVVTLMLFLTVSSLLWNRYVWNLLVDELDFEIRVYQANKKD
jgi:hypothetical protein